MLSLHDSNIAVLLSGGLDSSILLAQLLKQRNRVQPLYIQTDLYWQASELQSVKKFLLALGQQPELAELVILDLPLRDLYQQHWSISGNSVPDAASPDEAVFLPGRNALLLVKAVVWCQLHAIRNLALAPLGTSPFSDARDPFFENFQAAMNCGDLPAVRILRPFTGMSKRQVMEMGREYPLELTFSCIAPVQDKHCGKCNKCAERKQAFSLVGLADPTIYAH